MNYSKELKDALIRRMLPPNNESITKISKEEGISEQTLRNWRDKARRDGYAAPGTDVLPDDWSTQDKWKRKLSQETSEQPKFAEICFVDQQTEKHKGEIGSLFQVSYKGIEIVISSFATAEQITNLLVSAPRYLVERLPTTLTITAL